MVGLKPLSTRTLLLVLFACSAAAGDWPEFRGPTGQGISTAKDVPTHWSSEENVVWKAAIAGEGWSSPVLVGERIYLTAAVAPPGRDKDRILQTLCLDARTGKAVWQTDLFEQDGETAPRIHTKNSHASPTPVVAGDRLYVHFGHQGTACLDLNGKLVWKNRELAYKPVHGNGGSPILVDGLLIFNCDGGEDPFVVALNADNGQVVWKTPRPVNATKKFSFSTPLAIEVGGRKQVISPGSDAVCSFDPKTGTEIWSVRYEDGYSVIPRPVFAHGLVFISTGYNTPNLLAIRPDGSGDATDTHIAWSTPRGAPHTPSPVVAGDELYMVSDRGVASCLDARTGALHWQERLGGGFSASPVYAEGKLYFQNEEGVGSVIEASKMFRLIAQNDLKDRTLASYAVSDGTLFIRSASALFRIGKATAGGP